MELSKDIIASIEIINNTNNIINNNTIDIAFGVDEKFASYMGVVITSILINNKDDFFQVHVFTDCLDNRDLTKMKQLVCTYDNIEIKIYYVSKELFKQLPMNSIGSIAVYYRFIIPEILSGCVKKVLYLDADTLCIGNLSTITEIDMNENIVLAIYDQQLVSSTDDRTKKLGMSGRNYFNAGVLFIDIEKWRAEKISQYAIELLIKNPLKYEFWDQDVLNIVLEKRVMYIERKWNYMCALCARTYEDIPDDTVIIHFITGDKPWKSWTKHHMLSQLYYEYCKNSLWKDIVMVEPYTFKEMHRMALSYRKRSLYSKAMSWYLKYVIEKIKNISVKK